MMAAVQDALLGVDLVALIRDASASTGNGDRFVLDLVKRSEKPALLLLNKIDKLEDKAELLPLIDWYRNEYEWREIIPISALKDEMTDVLVESALRHLPEGEPIFSEDELTDQSIQRIAEFSNEAKEIITEAMAEVWAKQGHKEKAVEIYQKLSLLNPSKSHYFAARIEALKA
jgi:GTP-binding protein Era